MRRLSRLRTCNVLVLLRGKYIQILSTSGSLHHLVLHMLRAHLLLHDRMFAYLRSNTTERGRLNAQIRRNVPQRYPLRDTRKLLEQG